MRDVFDTYGLQNIWNDNKLVFNLDGKGNNNAENIKQHKKHYQNFIRKKYYSMKKTIFRIN